MFLIILQQLIKMLIIVLVGILCMKTKLVSIEGTKTVSNLLLMIVNPLLIITVYHVDYDPKLIKGLLLSFLAAIFAHFIVILLSHILIRKDLPDYELDRFCAIYANCGFIGIPLIYSVLGSEGVFYLTGYNTVFNIIVWTQGLALMKGKFELKHLKEGLMTPMIIATFLAMILFFFQIPIPDVLYDSIQYIADMNTPLAMLAAGFSIAQSNPKKIFSNKRIYKTAAIKLILYPLAVLLFVWICHFETTVAYTMIIAASCPTAAISTMMALRYNRNDVYCSEIFSVTTILSIVTIPIIMLIADFII